jgi:hypothetical protein
VTPTAARETRALPIKACRNFGFQDLELFALFFPGLGKQSTETFQALEKAAARASNPWKTR